MEISKLLALSFFLFAFATISSFIGAGADDINQGAPVLDIFGNTVSSDVDYYMFASMLDDKSTYQLKKPKIFPNVTFSNITNSQRVIFSPVGNSTDGVIREDSNLILNFHYIYDEEVSMMTRSLSSDRGDPKTKWVVKPSDEWPVVVGEDPTYDWFKLEKYNNFINLYSLLYCPKPEPYCQCECKYVGFRKEGETTYLVVTTEKQPFPIALGKAPLLH